jgi:hypothetical protein
MLGLAVLAAAFVATYLRTAPPDPLPADAPPGVFSAGRAADVLRSLVGDGQPHPIGSDANASLRAHIVDRFQALGYSVETQSAFACSGIDYACGTVHNAIARWRDAPAGKAVLLVTHYDSVAAGPGASDAGVSVAVALEVARALAASQDRFRNPIVFLVDDGEEAGLIGASAFVAGHPLAREVGAVVNLEARGTSGPSAMFETSGENAWLVDLLAGSLPRPFASSLFYPIYERLPNDTDLTVFKQAGIPGVNFAFIGDVARYHSPKDDADHASPGSLQHQGENALAIVRALAGADLENHQGGNVVFFDVLGSRIVAWPLQLTPVLAGLALLLVAVTALVARRVDEAPILRAIVGLVAWAVALAAAGYGTWKLRVWLGDRGAWPGGATTQPDLAVGGFLLAGFAAAVLVAIVLGRWSRPAGAWSGCWLGWSMAAVAAAVYAPEASYVLVVPALLAGVMGVAAVTIRGSAPGTLAGVVPLAAAAVLLMPPAWVLFHALGPDALPVSGTAMALVSTALAPLVARAGLVRWLALLLSIAGAGVLVALSMLAAPYSADSPERMNVVYYKLADEAPARWIVTPQSGRLPDAMRDAARFGAEREPAYAWSRAATAFVAEADAVPQNEPTLEVLERRSQNGRTVIRVRALSPRGAARLALMLPPDRVVSASMNGTPIPGRPADAETRLSQREGARAFRGYSAVTVPPGGVEMELVIEGSEPLEGYLFDWTSGLPSGGERLVAARPAEAAPNGTGDATILARRISVALR